MQIDDRFLKPHPATVLWWQQRDKCATCAHLVERGTTSNDDGSLGMRCRVVKRVDLHHLPGYEEHPNLKRAGRRSTANTKHKCSRPQEEAYCIDARMDGSPCGPDANLFVEKQR